MLYSLTILVISMVSILDISTHLISSIPALLAILETVFALSPLIILISTPCSLK